MDSIRGNRTDGQGGAATGAAPAGGAPGTRSVQLVRWAEAQGVPRATAAEWCLDGSFEQKTGLRATKLGARWYVEVPDEPARVPGGPARPATDAAGRPAAEPLAVVAPVAIGQLRRTAEALRDLADWLEGQTFGGGDRGRRAPGRGDAS